MTNLSIKSWASLWINWNSETSQTSILKDGIHNLRLFDVRKNVVPKVELGKKAFRFSAPLAWNNRLILNCKTSLHLMVSNPKWNKWNPSSLSATVLTDDLLLFPLFQCVRYEFEWVFCSFVFVLLPFLVRSALRKISGLSWTCLSK